MISLHTSIDTTIFYESPSISLHSISDDSSVELDKILILAGVLAGAYTGLRSNRRFWLDRGLERYTLFLERGKI
jgi:hypothetical protein